ncbi:G-patch domain and KOW motifs-containing protein-like [Tachypleus tridentatus]|uniref:G-patch domain and KOW motifs-containing protein-like n=1 Tax=Tachypleus tridentatus TaxID=6853 RepID=UPI003FCF5391
MTNPKPIVICTHSSEEKPIISSEETNLTKPELVIPLIQKNKWNLSSKKLEKDNGHNKVLGGDSSLEELAVKEIIEENNKQLQEWNNCFERNDNLVIPLLVENHVPDGFETDEKVDVSIRPDESTLEDYERVPVEEYGLAVLRGMGWKKGEPVGGKNKQCVEPMKVVLRPKGLGLGANHSRKSCKRNKLVNKECISLEKGSYVTICQGQYKGNYGQVEGFDDDSSRIIIRLALNKGVITLPEMFVQVISKNEYWKENKVINKEKYENYSNKNEKEEKSYVFEHNHSPLSHKNEDHSNCKKKKRHHHTLERHDDVLKKGTYSWLVPLIKVRFIDETYRNGKYYNTKVVIEDVYSSTSCLCRTDDGKLLEDIHPSMLETVIPRSESAHVLILSGKYKGKVGKIIKREKTKCLARVQLTDQKKVLELHYDIISEYAGDVSQHE